MQCWIALVTLLVLVNGQLEENEDDCAQCNGVGYTCINGQCFCASGYVPNSLLTKCVKCPGLGDRCYGPCCGGSTNSTLHCWQGVCQNCHDAYGSWICRDSMEQMLLITVSQIAMASALVLGIIGTFLLLLKLCSVTDLRPINTGPPGGSRLSVSSIQLYIDQRLRDAPPRYTRASPPGSSLSPAAFFVNAGFVHDSSVPPPPYTAERKDEIIAAGATNSTIHV